MQQRTLEPQNTAGPYGYGPMDLAMWFQLNISSHKRTEMSSPALVKATVSFYNASVPTWVSIFEKGGIIFNQPVNIPDTRTYYVNITNENPFSVTLVGNIFVQKTEANYRITYPYALLGFLIMFVGISALLFGIFKSPKRPLKSKRYARLSLFTKKAFRQRVFTSVQVISKLSRDFKVVVKPPGPKSKEVIERFGKSIMLATALPSTFAGSEAHGAIVKDLDGNTYLDLNQSTAVVGHNHPRVVKAVKSQVDKLLVGGGVSWTFFEPRFQMAEELMKHAPGRLRDEGRIAMVASGAESCDVAIKLARQRTHRQVVMCHEGAFHGMTGLTTSVTTVGYTVPSRRHYKPLISEVVYAPYPYCYRCALNQTYPDCNLACLHYLEHMTETVAPAENIAAVIIVPIQMANGVIVPPDEYMPGLKSFCEKNGILLIDDEIYTGFGKTGKFFAIDLWNVEPDIICIGKPFGGTLPLAAIIAKQSLIEGPKFMSRKENLVACVAAHETLRIIIEENLMENAVKVGNHIKKRLDDLAKEHELIGDVRGRGLLIGVELVKDRATKEPATEEAKKIVTEALNRGIIIGRGGLHSNVIRINPSLIITEEMADSALEVLTELFRKI